MFKIGIDDISLALPSLYLPIDDLAVARNIEPAKLRHGLGLIDMAICDIDEDVVTLAAKSVINLVEKNNIAPDQIGRIYVGTESSIDGSKPIASYVLGILSKHYKSKKIDSTALRNCDVVDMTFACIGAVDAMHNSLAYLHTTSSENKVAIVVATDGAKYELASSGEYTQGAGATAVLLKSDPRLLAIDIKVGVATKDEHDFFKPLRLKSEGDQITVEHKDTPVFDGQFSNQTYANRIIEAWKHFECLHDGVQLDNFSKFIFHLPYAYHGRRVMADLYFNNLQSIGQYQAFLKKANIEELSKEMYPDDYKKEYRAFLKARTKSGAYQKLVKEKIEAGERLSSSIGNVYTASIFISLLSTLINSADMKEGNELLFIAYGSGSKSKIFKGTLQSNWDSVLEGINHSTLFNDRKQISFQNYENIRKQRLNCPLAGRKSIHQNSSGVLETNRFAKYYDLN